MKTLFLQILLICQTAYSAEAPTLTFSANIKNESLSEESILLLHCLSDESGSKWELSNKPGTHFLSLKETTPGLAEGSYMHQGIETKIRLKEGDAESICKEIYPDTTTQKPVELKNVEPQHLEQEVSFSNTEPSKTNTKLIWIGASLLTVAGFFFWKAQQPEHRSMIMR